MRFLSQHLNEVNEGYFEHFSHAFFYARRLLIAGLACLIHAIFPFLCQRFGSQCVNDLYDKMAKRGRVGNDEPEVWLEFNI